MINDQIAEEEELGRSQFFLPRPSAKLIFDIMFTESATRIVNSYHVKLAEYFAESEKNVRVLQKYRHFFIINPEKKLVRWLVVILRNYTN